MSNNGWPDPARPGVPLNPDQEGWHWVQRVDKGFVPSPRIILWTDDWTDRQFSWDAIGYEDDKRKLGRNFRYLGPCLTPAEVEARVADALKWRDAINDGLTANCQNPIGATEAAKDALHRLLQWEITLALDPVISKSAADLVAEAKRDALEQATLEIKQRGDFWSQGINKEANIRADECQKIVAAICALKDQAND